MNTEINKSNIWKLFINFFYTVRPLNNNEIIKILQNKEHTKRLINKVDDLKKSQQVDFSEEIPNPPNR